MSEELARALVRATLGLSRVPDGTDGVRDVDNPCEMFETGVGGAGDCGSDGHYLCEECVHLSEDGAGLR